MNDDEQILKALPLAEPGAELDARMDRLFTDAIGQETTGRLIRLRYVFAASVMSAAIGAAAAVLVMKTQVPRTGETVYVERPGYTFQRPAFPDRMNPYDLSRVPIPVLVDSEWRPGVIPPASDPASKARQGADVPNV